MMCNILVYLTLYYTHKSLNTFAQQNISNTLQWRSDALLRNLLRLIKIKALSCISAGKLVTQIYYDLWSVLLQLAKGL